MSKVIGKVKTGVSGAVKSPARFIVSLGIGFALGVIVDIIMEYIALKAYTPLSGRLEVGFSIYYGFPEVTSIAYDDLIMILITVLMLFSKKFVTTLGFFLGWYISSNEQLASRLGLYPEGA